MRTYITIQIILYLIILIITYFSLNSGFFSNTTKFDSELGWSNKRSISKVSKGNIITTNSLGFRSTNVDPSKKHILLVGDSVAWGFGVSDNQTIAYHLDKKITNMQTLNLGVPGYGIDQSYIRLKRHIGKLNPELIIFIIFTANDLLDLSQDTRFGKTKPFFVPTGNIKIKNGKSSNYYEKNIKLINNHVSQFSCMNLLSRGPFQWRSELQTLRSKYCTQRTLDKISIGYVFRSLIMKFVQLSMEYNSKIIFVISPQRGDFRFSNIDEYKNKVNEIHKATPEKRSQLIKLVSYGNSFYKSHFPFVDLNNIQIHFSKAKLPYIDFYKIIKKSNIKVDNFYLDDAHYSPFGNEFLAETIIKYIDSIELDLG